MATVKEVQKGISKIKITEIIKLLEGSVTATREIPSTDGGEPFTITYIPIDVIEQIKGLYKKDLE